MRLTVSWKMGNVLKFMYVGCQRDRMHDAKHGVTLAAMHIFKMATANFWQPKNAKKISRKNNLLVVPLRKSQYNRC